MCSKFSYILIKNVYLCKKNVLTNGNSETVHNFSGNTKNGIKYLVVNLNVSCFKNKCKQFNNCLWSNNFDESKSESCTNFNAKQERHFSTTPRRPTEPNREALLLVRFPNPLLWMKMKWKFRKLNYFWDPDFDEAEFVRGARQAVVTITHLIGDNNFDDLKGLLTKEALQKLRQEVTLTWPEILKQHIALSNHHIKAITPINVRMMENTRNEKRFCDVDILYIALKRILYREKRNHRILVFNILSRFHRNYTEGAIPNWTVAIFTMDVVAHKPNW